MNMVHQKTPRHSSVTTSDQLARGLGWFSIALGATQLVFPGALARMLGLQGKERLIRGYGGREIATGIGALSSNPAPAIWARVTGDLLDLATLTADGGRDRDQRRNAGIALAAVAGITLLDILVAAALYQQTARPANSRDYSTRTGFPKGKGVARGAAADFKTPADMRATPPIKSFH